MNNVRKPIHPQHPTSYPQTPKWRHVEEQVLPCKGRLVAIKSLQSVRQKWLVPGKTRWCDYA